MFLSWTEMYTTTIPEMDEHHKKLFALLNALYQNIMECKTLEAERELTGTLLQELHDYTCYHFVAEEELLQSCNYPGLVEHQSQHQVFLYKLEAMAKVYADGGLAMSFEAFVFLRDWIVEHVLNSDVEYVPYVKRLL